MKADVVAVVDDDNIPMPCWGENLLVGTEVEVNYYETDLPAFDPVGATNYPSRVGILNATGNAVTLPVSQLPATNETPGRAGHLNRELSEISKRLEVLTPEWEAAASKLAGTE